MTHRDRVRGQSLRGKIKPEKTEDRDSAKEKERIDEHKRADKNL